MRKLTLISLLAVLMLLLAACGGASTGTSDTTDTDTTTDTTMEEGAPEEMEETSSEPMMSDVTIMGTDMLKFEPADLTAKVGETLNITLDVPGALEHNITWTDGDTLFVAVKPGESASASRTFDMAGAYEFYCSVPGHKEAGMVGKIVVE